MIRVALLSLLVCACTIPQLEAGRYACQHGQENQCPGQWRCGLENVCHRLGDTGTAWQCADDEDCEAGFVCGLTNDRQARECHDPAAGRAWQCEVATDCTGGWQCGLSKSREARECHDPAAPRDWPCEGEADCSGGWVCGLSFTPDLRECHNPAAPREWRCNLDADCVGGYRCAADERCVSPLADALEQGATPSIDAGARINPLSSTSPMEHVSIAPTYTAGLGRGKRSALFTQDERLRSLVIDPLRNTVVQRDLGPATDIVTLAAQGARGTDTNGVSDDVNRGYVALTDGGVSFMVLDGTGSPVFFDLQQPTDHFKWGSTTDSWVPSLIAFSERPEVGSPYSWALARIRGDDFVLYDFLETPFLSGYLDFGVVAGNRLIDVAGLQRDNQTECTFAVDQRGLWVAQRGQPPFVTSAAFVPLPLPGFRSACGPGDQFRALSTLSDRWLAAATEPSDGGQPRVTLFDAQRMWIDRSTSTDQIYCTALLDSCDPSDAIPIDVQFGPCTACPSGSTLLDMAVIAVPGAAAPAIEVRCRESDGSSRLLRLTGQSQSSTQCLRELLVGTGSLFTEQLQSVELLAPGAIAFHGTAGQLWAGASTLEAHSITFDRAAFGVVRLSSSPWDVIAFADGIIGTPTAVGLLSNPSRVAAAVRNAPGWAISGSEVLSLGEGTSVADARPVAAAATVFQTPTSATIVPTRDGRQLIVTAGNRIYAADLNATLDGGDLLAVVTERGAVVSSIESLAFAAEVPSTTEWASGYAVSGGAVIRLVADSPTRWHSEPVDLPPTPSPLSVWYQGSRARVGFEDGTVFSLPSRVAIARQVPGGAVGFEQVCGQQLALSPQGLFRLEKSGVDPVGVWRQLMLPEPFPQASWESGSIHAAGSELFLFTRTGEALGITFEGCPLQ